MKGQHDLFMCSCIMNDNPISDVALRGKMSSFLCVSNYIEEADSSNMYDFIALVM